MKWKVGFTNKAEKQTRILPEETLLTLQVLITDLQNKGPVPGPYWPNYGKLNVKQNIDLRHCHILKGRPTYVCCWEVSKSNREIKVYYVGTHEKAPY